MTEPGHVFVVRGLLENLDHDAVVLPTDRDFWVTTTWRGVLDMESRTTDASWRAATRAMQPAG